MLDTFDPKSFVLLEVDEGDSPETWTAYLTQHRLQGTQVHDDSRQLQSLFHVTGFPTYLILDRDGLIHNRYSGAVGDLRADIRKLLTTPSTAAPSTEAPPSAAPSLTGNER